MSDYKDQWDKMIDECRRRGYAPMVILRWARAFESIRNLQIKKTIRKKTPYENQQR